VTESLFSLFLILTLLLAGLSACTTALETAFLTLNADGRRLLRRTHPPAAKNLERCEEEHPEAAACLSLADAIWNTALLLTALLAIRQLQPKEEPVGWLTLGLVFLILIFFCEFLPKLFGWHKPVQVLRHGMPLLLFSVSLCSPWVSRLQRWPSLLPWGSKVESEGSPSEEEEIRENYLHLLAIAGEEGPLDAAEARALREIVQLGFAEATHLMTPRVESFLLPGNLDEEEARAALRRQRTHWVPVFAQTRDEILGLLNVEEYFLHPGASYTERLLSPSFVPESMNALQLLSAFLSRRQKMALLLDEYGGFEGLVTLSDAMEEVFGIEGPGLGSGIYIENIGPGRFLAGGHARLDDLCESLHTPLPESEAETIAGWLAAQHGTIPRVGETFPFGPWQIAVRRASRKRIKEVLIEPRPTTTGGHPS
jgi:putative hemolysin